MVVTLGEGRYRLRLVNDAADADADGVAGAAATGIAVHFYMVVAVDPQSIQDHCYLFGIQIYYLHI